MSFAAFIIEILVECGINKQGPNRVSIYSRPCQLGVFSNIHRLHASVSNSLRGHGPAPGGAWLTALFAYPSFDIGTSGSCPLMYT